MNFPGCIEARNCQDSIDNDLDNLTDCEDLMECSSLCIKTLQQNVTQLQQQLTQMEERTSKLEVLVRKIIKRGRCVLFGVCEN